MIWIGKIGLCDMRGQHLHGYLQYRMNVDPALAAADPHGVMWVYLTTHSHW